MPESEARVGFRQVFMLALPIIASNLSVPLVGLVDTAVMGRLDQSVYIGAVALGAVTFSSLFWAFGFLRMGTTGLAAQAWGRKDGGALKKLFLNSAMLAVVFAGLVLLAGPLIAWSANAFLGAQGQVSDLLGQYIDVRLWSAPAVLFNYLLIGFFIGLQKTGYALISQLSLNLTNAGLSVLFVLSWGWGVEGVALASVIAEYFALLVGAVLLASTLGGLSGHWQIGTLIDWPAYRRLLSVNADIFVRTLCLLFAFAWFARQGTALGATVLAANAVLLQFIHLLSYGLDGFAHAAEALVGQAVGARSRAALVNAIRLTTVLAVLTALLYVAAYALFGGAIIDWLTTQEEVRTAAAEYLPWLVAMPVLAVWSYQLDGVFIGSLQTAEMRNAMLVSTAIYWVGVFVAVDLLGNHGLWLSLALFFCLRAVTLGVYLRFRFPV